MGKDETKRDTHSKTMSLGDHLEELRSRLILALVGFALVFIVCLFFGKYIIAVIQDPYVSIAGEKAKLVTLSPTEVVISYMRISLITALIFSSPWRH